MKLVRCRYPVLEGWNETHVFCGNLPPVRVHAGQDVDSGGVHEALDVLVPGQVRGAQVVSQVQ